MPLVSTLIASAVDSVPVGVFSVVRPSSVSPERSSLKICTTRRTSARAGGSAGSCSALPSSAKLRNVEGSLGGTRSPHFAGLRHHLAPQAETDALEEAQRLGVLGPCGQGWVRQACEV